MAGSRVQVFLSYAKDDRNTARQLAEELRERSFHVWMDEDQLQPGDNWAEQMGTALRQSDAMVVLLTAKSVRSEWVRRDIEYALSSPRFEHRLIPVVIGRGDEAPWLERAPWVLRELHMVTSPNVASASQQVASILKDVA